MKLSNAQKTALFLILEGIAAAVILNLYNPFTQMFAKRMGAGDIHIALINSLPQLVAILVLIPCSIYIDKVRNKKLATCLLILFNSLFYALIAFVPFLPDGIRLIFYVLLIGLMNWPGSLYTTTWQSFFCYTFSGNEANRVYSLRSKYSAFFGMLAALVAGYILAVVPKNDSQRVAVYQIIYAACFAISIFQSVALSKAKQENSAVQACEITDSGFRMKDFREIFSNKRFIIYSLCAFAFHVSWHMGWPLFFIYHTDIVKANEFQLGMISVIGGLSQFLSYSMWNRVVEKKGGSIVIFLGALGLAMNPFLYLMTNHILFVLLINVFIGVAVAGFNLSLFCNLLNILPENKKTVYISFFNTFINISGFASPLIGVWMNRHTGIVKAFLIIGLFRIITSMFFAIRWFTDKSIPADSCKRSC
ncbi:MAG: MFS transporter [Clostridia bacterium]|nr:MFS transporter [Clostridia bacterium]